MKNLLLLLLLFTSFFCKADYWKRKADFPGGERHGAYSFAIGNKAYVGGGWDSVAHKYNDLWEYDQFTNTWTQKGSIPITGRVFAASFSIPHWRECSAGSLVSTQVSRFVTGIQ